MLRQTRIENKWFGHVMSTDEEEYARGRVMDWAVTCRGERRVEVIVLCCVRGDAGELNRGDTP